jgi:hypothetical protein
LGLAGGLASVGMCCWMAGVTVSTHCIPICVLSTPPPWTHKCAHACAHARTSTQTVRNALSAAILARPLLQVSYPGLPHHRGHHVLSRLQNNPNPPHITNACFVCSALLDGVVASFAKPYTRVQSWLCIAGVVPWSAPPPWAPGVEPPAQPRLRLWGTHRRGHGQRGKGRGGERGFGGGV